MDVSIEKETLESSLKSTLIALSSRPATPIQSALVLKTTQEGLVLSASNIDITAKTKDLIKTTSQEEILVPGRKFAEIIMLMPNKKIKLETKDKNIIISCEKKEYSLPLINNENYLEQADSTEKVATVKAKELAQAIEQASSAAAKEDGTPILTTIKTEIEENRITLTALDRYRITKKICPVKNHTRKEKIQVFVKNKIMSELARGVENKEEVDIYLDNIDKPTKITFVAQNCTITSQLMSGDFPPTEKLFEQEYKKEVVIKKNEIVNALNTLSIISEVNGNVKIKNKKNIIELNNTNNSEFKGLEQIETKYNGEDFEITLNLQYFKEGISQIKEENIKIEIEEATKPIRITGDNEKNKDFQYILVPIRGV